MGDTTSRVLDATSNSASTVLNATTGSASSVLNVTSHSASGVLSATTSAAGTITSSASGAASGVLDASGATSVLNSTIVDNSSYEIAAAASTPSTKVDSSGVAALLRSCKSGDARTASRILKTQSADLCSPNVDCRRRCWAQLCDSWGWSPLYYACEGGHVDVVDVLLQAGAPLHDLVGPSTTALCTAASHGHVDAVEHLLAAKAGFTVNSRTAQDDDDSLGMTTLHCVVQAFGRKLKEKDTIRAAPLRDCQQILPKLQKALMRSDDKACIVKLLCETRADVNAWANEPCPTPLQEAATSGNAPIVQVLLEARADVGVAERPADLDANFNIKYPDAQKMTPLMRAMQGGHSEVVRTLQGLPKLVLRIQIEPKGNGCAGLVLYHESGDRAASMRFNQEHSLADFWNVVAEQLGAQRYSVTLLSQSGDQIDEAALVSLVANILVI